MSWVIETEEQLREIYGETEDLAVKKCLSALEEHSRNFIANSPFLVISTSDGKTGADASPRGEDPGFVGIVDDKHLFIPDRPGNNRLDSFLNVMACPYVGLLFMIPGIRETLRINGRAKITNDPDLLAQHVSNGKSPISGMLVEIDEIFLHCAKALIRSRLWRPESWPEKQVIPSAGRIWRDHLDQSARDREYDTARDDELEKSMKKNLY